MHLRYMARKFARWQERKQNQAKNNAKGSPGNDAPQQLSTALTENVAAFRSILGDQPDIKIHEFMFGTQCQFQAVLIYIEGLVSSILITESIMKPLILSKEISSLQEVHDAAGINLLKSTVLCSGNITQTQSLSQLIDGCLSGNTVLLLDQTDQGLLIGTEGWEKRSVTEPQTELVVRGPREGFTENLITNTTLLRRKIRIPEFKLEYMKLGRKTATKLCIAYIDSLAKPELVQTVRHRLSSIDVDSIMDSGYIEQYIEDAPLSIFSTVGYSEKPDVVAAKLLEGRVAIVVDGSPLVLTAPLLFIESFQTAEDYYVRPFYASLSRILRILAYFITIFFVPIYIAMTTQHQELIPSKLLFTIASAREGTPFPALIEGLIMVFSFEILREAGLRLPRAVGQAISIVGALVMGDAAVAAGLVGAPMVIVVAIAAVASFVVPQQADSVSILRLLLMVLASVLGGFGLAMGFLAILVHLATLSSFGVPFFRSLLPSYDQQDIFVRLPLWTMAKRPQELAGYDVKRRDTFVPPAGTGHGDEGNNK